MAQLAKADMEAIIAVEIEDDVSVHLPDGGFILEQDKHTLGDRCPFGDTSKDLWRTLDIWTSLTVERSLQSKHCSFLLVTNVPIPAGLTRVIHETNASSAASSLKLLRKTASMVPDSIKELASRVIAFDDGMLRWLLTNISCVDSATNSHGPALRHSIASDLHLPDDVDSHNLLNLLHGWVSDTLLTNWRNGKPGLIMRRAFDRQLHRHIEQFRRYKRYGLPEHLVPFAREELRDHRKRRYVQQLTAVTNDAHESIEAITDYVRCSTERFRLAAEGELTEDDWADFENNLLNRWRNIFRRAVRLRFAENQEMVGYSILCETREVNADLGGDLAHRYLVMGTYHRFADDKHIGWHPRYTEIIK